MQNAPRWRVDGPTPDLADLFGWPGWQWPLVFVCVGSANLSFSWVVFRFMQKCQKKKKTNQCWESLRGTPRSTLEVRRKSIGSPSREGRGGRGQPREEEGNESLQSEGTTSQLMNCKGESFNTTVNGRGGGGNGLSDELLGKGTFLISLVSSWGGGREHHPLTHSHNTLELYDLSKRCSSFTHRGPPENYAHTSYS